MFTGIITQCNRVLAIHKTGTTAELEIAALFADVQMGESIAIDGVCLSVTKITDGRAEGKGFCLGFDISPETWQLTTLQFLLQGSKVNMERALRVGDRLGGHCVTGHVDQVCSLAAVTQERKFLRMRFSGLNETAIHNLIQKGSIAVNGVSLTVNAILKHEDGSYGFEVMLIPQTLAATNLSQLTVSDKVNIEFDMLVKVMNNRIARSYLDGEKTADKLAVDLTRLPLSMRQLMNNPFISIEQALLELQQGRMLILVDSESRENEGDLMVAAEKITPEHINFMVTYGRGVVCLALTGDILDRCQIPMMAPRNRSRLQAPFTMSIDAVQGISTGVSATDRACTIQKMMDPRSGPEDFMIPGHIFPLRADPGGVLAREGHTEGSTDLARLAGLQSASVICEVMNDDGSMARLNDLILFADKYDLSLVSMQDVIAAVKLQAQFPKET